MARDLTSVGLVHRFVCSIVKAPCEGRGRELIILARGILRASPCSRFDVSTPLATRRVASLDQTDLQALSSRFFTSLAMGKKVVDRASVVNNFLIHMPNRILLRRLYDPCYQSLTSSPNIRKGFIIVAFHSTTKIVHKKCATIDVSEKSRSTSPPININR